MRELTNYIEIHNNKILLGNITNPMQNKYPQILLTEESYKRSWEFVFFVDKSHFDETEYRTELRKYILPNYEHTIIIETIDYDKYKVTLSYKKPSIIKKIIQFFRR